MAWTPPRTWIPSELVTAALLNLHLRDNLLALGQIRINSGGSTFTRRRHNFIAGSGISLALADDSPNDEADLTVALAAGAGTTDYGTTLPTSGLYNGYRFIYFTGGVAWSVIYRADLDATYPWHFAGGADLENEVATIATRGSVTYGDPTSGTTGPSLTLPRPGVYDVAIGCNSTQNTQSGFGARMSYAIGATAADDADRVYHWQGITSGNTDGQKNLYRERRKTFPSAVALVMKYRTDNGNAENWADRFMRLTPVKIS